MIRVGWLLLLTGVGALIFGSTMSTSVEVSSGYLVDAVHNLSLADQKRNILIVSGFVTLASVILLAAGYSFAKPRDV